MILWFMKSSICIIFSGIIIKSIDFISLILHIIFFNRFCSLFLLAFLGILYPYNRGSLFTSIILIYSLTSVVSGYTSASFYCQFAENGWVNSASLCVKTIIFFYFPYSVSCTWSFNISFSLLISTSLFSRRKVLFYQGYCIWGHHSS